MRNVKLSFLLIFFLIFGFSHQGSANCPWNAKSNTEFHSAFTWKGWLKEIQVIAIKDQGINGYFNPKIKVCSKGGESYPEFCRELYSETSCKIIYDKRTTQASGAAVSAMTFIDWEGNKTSIGAKMGEGLEWEWADGVTDEEKEKFANSPKICACSQKGACMTGVSAWGAKAFSGANIFRPGEMENVCDTCYQTKVKCAPIPLAPGPPPFCEQLGMSPPQVRIVPVTSTDNDYFNPKVKVIIGDLKDENGKIGKQLDFPKERGKDKAKELPILDEKSTTYYFKTYREKGQLCTEYHGTKGIDENKNLEFTRCFPAPPAPQPEIVKIVDEKTLKIKMKMREDTCRAHGTYNIDSCIFNINTHSTENVDPPFLKVIKPQLVTTNNDLLKKILNQSKDKDFKILEKYGFVPDIQVGCTGSKDFYDLKDFNKERMKKCKFDSNGQPEIEIAYKTNDKSKMFCISGWKPEPEEFVLERESEVIPLKTSVASYVKHNTVYSKESKQFYYFTCNEIVDLLAKPQSQLDEIIFDKLGYVSIPKDNEGRSHCPVDKNDEMDAKQDCNNCKIVYELKNKEHKKECNQGDDDCMCFNSICEHSTQYVNTKDNEPFYLRYVNTTYENEKKETVHGKVLEVPTKANRTEVFYADKLCMFDLEGLKKRLHEIIMKQLNSKREKLLNDNTGSYEYSGSNSYTDDLSKFDHVEIEAWGGGEAGHIKDSAHSTENRQGMPGDYIKAKLKIDPHYPFIQVKVTEGGGGQEYDLSNKDGGPTIIKMCKNSSGSDCESLITVAGGGKYKIYGVGRDQYKNTIIHEEGLKVEATIIKGSEVNSIEDNQIPYIKDGKIEYETVSTCTNSRRNIPGSGGCINKSSEIYSKGSPGYAIIKPMMNEVNENTISAAIEGMINNLSDDAISIDDSLKNLDDDIIKTIEEEIRKELSGK